MEIVIRDHNRRLVADDGCFVVFFFSQTSAVIRFAFLLFSVKFSLASSIYIARGIKKKRKNNFLTARNVFSCAVLYFPPNFINSNILYRETRNASMAARGLRAEISPNSSVLAARIFHDKFRGVRFVPRHATFSLTSQNLTVSAKHQLEIFTAHLAKKRRRHYKHRKLLVEFILDSEQHKSGCREWRECHSVQVFQICAAFIVMSADYNQ